MEKKWRLKLFLLFLLCTLSHSISIDLPAHGCHWTESCQSKWFGGCDAGQVTLARSDNCNGLCPDPEFSPCLPFYTRFHCCTPETPEVTDRCAKCKNKLDYGDEYVCCSDCSEPDIIDGNTKLGYCRTGAELAVQLKPREHFKWVAGPWMPCSTPCDGGIRYRDVECFGQMEDMSIPHYSVDDSKCSGEEMPPRQESCNLRSCESFNVRGSQPSSKSSGMSAWLVTLLVLVGIIAVGGLGFAGYTLYQRRNSSQQGSVYIMLDGYS